MNILVLELNEIITLFNIKNIKQDHWLRLRQLFRLKAQGSGSGLQNF